MAADIQWMLGSLEWDFATKVTVAVIGGISAVLVAWIGARKARSNSQEIAEAPKPSRPVVSAPVPMPGSLTPVPTKPRRGDSIPFTHSEISAHIKRGTPYQQSLLEKDYVGATVRWRGILRSIDRYADGKATVVVDCADDGSHVSCDAIEADIVDLRLAEAGGMIEVVGVIVCVSSAYTELSECLIRLVAAEVAPKGRG
jgi:hypothetical protein